MNESKGVGDDYSWFAGKTSLTPLSSALRQFNPKPQRRLAAILRWLTKVLH